MKAEMIESWMLRTITETLQASSNEIPLDAPLTSLGLDSVRLLELAGELAEFIDCDIPTTMLWQFPTIKDLSRELAAISSDNTELANTAVANRDSPQLLSFSQERVWNYANHTAEGDYNNIFENWEIRGTLNVPVLQQSLSAIVQRHEILRTTFSMHEGAPAQSIRPFTIAPLTTVDLSTEASPIEAANKRLNELQHQGVNTQGDGLFHVFLFTLSDSEYRIVIRFHHLLYDAASLAIFYKELNENYNSLLNQDLLIDRRQISQVIDFARRQRDRFSNDRGKTSSSEDWWIEHWTNHPTAKRLKLPALRRTPVEKHSTKPPTLFERSIPSELLEGVKALSTQHGATEYTILLSAFVSLLYAHGNLKTLTIATYSSDRSETAAQQSIGFFINLLAFRFNFVGKQTGLSIIENCQATLSNCAIHQELPFEMLVEKLEALGHKRPRLDVIFQKIPSLKNSLSLSQLQNDRWESEGTLNNTWGLTVDIVESDNGSLSARFRFNPNRYQPSKVEQLLEQYLEILEGIVTSPEGQIPVFKKFKLF